MSIFPGKRRALLKRKRPKGMELCNLCKNCMCM